MSPTLTEAQSAALERLWTRDQDTVTSNRDYEREQATQLPASYTTASWPNRDAMLASVQHGYDCVMIQWRGMWLGIETDGYTHS